MDDGTALVHRSVVSAAAEVPHASGAIRPVNVANLVALFAPGAAFAMGLFALRDDPRFAWIRAGRPPAELFVIAVAGALATAAGVADWRFHRQGHRVVSRTESRVELVALAGGGGPLLLLMAWASVRANRGAALVPILVTALFTAAAITYDELRFHGRSPARERAFHGTLVGGMAVAWLAWMHWLFARSAP
jgi:hypothetical protein